MKKFLEYLENYKLVKWLLIGLLSLVVLNILIVALAALANVFMSYHLDWTVDMTSIHNAAWLSFFGNAMGATLGACIAGLLTLVIVKLQLNKEELNRKKEANEKLQLDIILDIYNNYKKLKQLIISETSNMKGLFALVDLYCGKINALNKEIIDDIYKKLELSESNIISIKQKFDDFMQQYDVILFWIKEDTNNKIDFNYLKELITNLRFSYSYLIINSNNDIIKLQNSYNIKIKTLRDNIRHYTIGINNSLTTKYLKDSFPNIEKCEVELVEWNLPTKSTPQ